MSHCPITHSLSLTYKLKFWANILASKTKYHTLTLNENQLILYFLDKKQFIISLLDIHPNVIINSGWLWDTLTFRLMSGESIEFGGVEKKKSKKLKFLLNECIQDSLLQFNQHAEPILNQAIIDTRLLFSENKYIRHDTVFKWLDSQQDLIVWLKHKEARRFLNADVLNKIQHIEPILIAPEQAIEQSNLKFINHTLLRFQTFFDHIETNPLTERQRRACVVDERHNLVLAGAGTGKTSTMIGRAGYLIKAGLAQPDQILMLAYARKAAEEMDERIRSKLGIDNLMVKTFHSLGMHIIACVEAKVPHINKMAEDSSLKMQFVERQLQKLLLDDHYKSKLVNYFLKFTYPYKSQYDFKSLGEYNANIIENDIRTLQGEQVKSYEELEIANFLYQQGIAYEYEPAYEFNTTGPDYKSYQPDFYLKDYGIYIEHFAINEHNQTPPFINQKSYLEGMAWKRALHLKHQSLLIETYSYLKKQGRLTDVLSEKLRAAGVVFHPVPANQLLKQLNELGRVSEFTELMSQILALFKANFSNIPSLIKLGNNHTDHERMNAAIALFEPIYNSYQQYLRESDSIDFEDMIAKAIEYVECGRYQSSYRYLLVDEFQDISVSRYRLLKALLAQHSDSSIFCVGDDWQSIYRFSGSDVSITKNFDQYFGFTFTSILDQSFRFNNKIGEVASRFVTQNPNQIRKRIESHRRVDQPAVSLIKTNQDSIGITAALDAIVKKSSRSTSVLILARFHFKKPELAKLKQRYQTLSIEFMSVHASKGKEADYVVVLGLEKGKNGFPSEKTTHPLVEMLLPPQETFYYAEERRLFYVALTRAKNHVYLITDANNPSLFIRELIENQYSILVDEFKGQGFQTKFANIRCQQCETGFLVPRDSQFGSFLGCNQYPRCNFTQKACQRCGGGMLQKGKFKVCENPRCDYVEPICPDCGGTLSLRSSQHGQFWGCSNYRKNAEFSCSHTEKFIDLQSAKLH